jgi:hypothetical protein
MSGRYSLPPLRWHIRKNRGFTCGWLAWRSRWETPLPSDALRFRTWQDAVEYVRDVIGGERCAPGGGR